MRAALSVNGKGLDPCWRKVHDVVVAEVSHGEVSSWELHEIEWDRLHDEGSHGTYHAKIIRFLTTSRVDMVVIDHAGQSMLNTMAKMGPRMIMGQTGSARQTALRTAASQSRA